MLNKIRTKLTLILIVVSLIPFITIGLITINISKEAMLNKTFAQLESVRDSKKHLIDLYFDRVKADIAVLANNSRTGAALNGFSSTLNEGKIDKNRYDFFVSLEYGELFSIFCQEYEYNEVLLINKNGDIVYSLKEESYLAKNVLNAPLKNTNLGKYFKKGLESITMTDYELYSLSGNQPTAFLFAPIKILGKVEGTAVLKLSIDPLNKIMIGRSGMGKTGEAFSRF